MITKKAIRDSIRASERAFEECWAILTAVKNRDASAPIAEFQPILAQCLMGLRTVDAQIGTEQRRLISRKRSYSRKWFSRRMKALASYQEVIRKASGLGRGIGDGFAWLFYMRDRELLIEHSKHEMIRSLPSGIGGLGELEFVRGVRKFEDKFVLYHGITTILRIADVTLIDLRSHGVVALGELKTKETSPGHLSIRCHFTGSKRRWKRPLASLPVGETEVTDELPPRMEAKLRAQVKSMTDAILSSGKARPSMRMTLDGAMYYPELERALSRAQRGKTAYEQAGKGLLLCAIPMRGRTLYSRLSGMSAEKVSDQLADVAHHAIKLVPEVSPLNALIMGGIYWDRDEFPQFPPGTVPPLWWPIAPELLHKLVFGKILVATLFNPAHLLKQLETFGFTVIPLEPRGYTIRLSRSKKTLQVENFPAFKRLITHALHSEDMVAEMMRNSSLSILRRKIAPGTRIDFHYFQVL